jgi:hypothetical protein
MLVWTIDDDLVKSVVSHAAMSVAVEEGVPFHPLLARLVSYILTCIAIHSHQGFTSADAFFAWCTSHTWMLPIALPWSPSWRSQIPDINWLARWYVFCGNLLHPVWDHMCMCVDLMRKEAPQSTVEWWAGFEQDMQLLL